MPDLICRFHDQTARSGTSENALRTEDGLVHVGLDLEDESRELVTAGIHGLDRKSVV